MIADLQEQLREDASERRRLLLELQAKIESSQQDLQITVTQLAAMEQQTRQLAHQIRLLAICSVGIAVAVLASMIMVAVVLARTWH